MDLATLAETTAITEACEKLRGNDLVLDEVTSLCAQFRAELDQVNGELNRQVAGQVHDSSFASSMLSKAVVEMDGVGDSLQKISQCCEQVREQTPGFENLKRATVAKRNLHSVIEQLDLYGRVPNRVRRLLSELEREPRGDNLRRIFREWLGLSAWRDRVVGHVEDEATKAAQAEERAWRRARGEILPNDTPQRAEEDSKTPSSASYETMLALLKDHFRDSYILGDRIFELVMDAAEKSFELAKERPQDLVCIAEICERRDRQVLREMRRRGLIKEGVSNGANDDNDDGGSAGGFDSKRVQFLARLGECADERAARVLKQVSDDPKSKQQRMRFDDLILAADSLLIDLQIVARDVRPCFPRAYDPLGLFRKWYEARLTRELSERVHDSYTEEELPSKEMLGMANWIARYVSAVHSFYSGDDVADASSDNKRKGVFPKDVIGLERLCDNLLERYLQERVMPRIAVAARRRDELKYEIIKVDPEEGSGKYQRSFLKTNHPEDFFSILSQELNNCVDHFSGERSLKVFQTLVQFATTWFLPKQEAKLNDLIKQTDASVAALKKSKKRRDDEAEDDGEESAGTLVVERICAWMSDAARCEDLVRLLFDSSVDGLMRCEDVAGVIGRASDVVEDACSQFSDSALRFSRTVLVETRVYADVDEKVFPEMFTKEWEESRYLGARIITATLDDWFNHPVQGLCGWISSDFVLGRTLLFCLEGLVKRYVDTLLKWRNKFGSAKRAAGRVEEDAKAFALFFKRNLSILKMANSASCRTEDDVDRKFRIFSQLADILQGDEYNLDPLLESLGSVEHAKVVIKRLRALRGGRVFNRREADLEKELVSNNVGNATNGDVSSVFAIAEIATLGDKVGEFEGELAAASFVETVSTEKQIAFVKKISAFAKATSFSQSKKRPSLATASAKGEELLRQAATNAGDEEEPEPTRVLSMDEFVAPSQRRV